MMGYIILAFLVGGAFGMVGMAILAYGPKESLLSENHFLYRRLEFLEKEAKEKPYTLIKDPRPYVHSLVN